jgi:plastocyanin
MRHGRVRRLAALSSTVVSLGCGGGGGTTPSPADVCVSGDGTTGISIGNNFFSPDAVSVPVGTTVTWTWNSAGTPHNVTFIDGPPPLPAQSCTQGAGTHSVTFTTVGTYSYTCTIHAMSGAVTVTP